ncbi:PadR family transcriptional regulator [Paraflavitalea speifideaquila]|uniref:PadR family transcriptional regulator n=1 Tax=Paraflavitalea speifideaquila TaxID=3076558 RepID=UPI0028E637F4|nr:PadR family transcriptional regulator [Paraflavitalea speifideiaquila]
MKLLPPVLKTVASYEYREHTEPDAEGDPGVLHSFHHSPGEAYPSDIVDEMRGCNLQILEGTLYPLLTRLKNSDMLTYRWVESNSGPPRKYFSLTPKGEEFYKELEATWNELANAVNSLTSKKNRWSQPPAVYHSDPIPPTYQLTLQPPTNLTNNEKSNQHKLSRPGDPHRGDRFRPAEAVHR